MAISKETEDFVWKRAKGRCENKQCRIVLKRWASEIDKRKWDFHHRYFKSQYKKKDRDEPRNLSLLCHYKCHTSWPEWVHWLNHMLDEQEKKKADRDKPHSMRSKEWIKRNIQQSSKEKLKREREQRKLQNENYLEQFKKKHDNLNPTEYSYAKNKEYLKLARRESYLKAKEMKKKYWR